jgi:hypothetical protein
MCDEIPQEPFMLYNITPASTKHDHVMSFGYVTARAFPSFDRCTFIYSLITIPFWDGQCPLRSSRYWTSLELFNGNPGPSPLSQVNSQTTTLIRAFWPDASSGRLLLASSRDLYMLHRASNRKKDKQVSRLRYLLS